MSDSVETAVLSCLYSEDKSCVYLIKNLGLTADYFVEPVNKHLVGVILSYFDKYYTLIPESILEREVSKNSSIPDSVKPEVLHKAKLLEGQKDSIDPSVVDYWFEELKKERLARQLQASMLLALDKVDKEGGVYTAYEQLSESLSQLDTVIHPDSEETQSINDEEWVQKRLRSYQEKAQSPETHTGVKLGITELDSITNGVYSGELWVVVSRTNVGKSALLNVCAHNAFRYFGKNVLFAGLEMGLDANSNRFDALYSGLSLTDIQNGWLTPDAYSQYEEALMGLTYERNKLFYIPQRKAQTVQQIQRELVIIERTHKLKIDMVVIDYLNILKSSTPGKQRVVAPHDYIRIVAEESRALGWLHSVAVLTAAQLNRLGADSKVDVGTETISMSDYIGNTADLVLRLFQTPEDFQRNVLKGTIMKARRCEKKSFEMSCDLSRMYIGDMPTAIASLD